MVISRAEMGRVGSGPKFHVNFGSGLRSLHLWVGLGRVKKIGPTSDSDWATKFPKFCIFGDSSHTKRLKSTFLYLYAAYTIVETAEYFRLFRVVVERPQGRFSGGVYLRRLIRGSWEMPIKHNRASNLD